MLDELDIEKGDRICELENIMRELELKDAIVKNEIEDRGQG